jgi:hypothetical protein
MAKKAKKATKKVKKVWKSRKAAPGRKKHPGPRPPRTKS